MEVIYQIIYNKFIRNIYRIFDTSILYLRNFCIVQLLQEGGGLSLPHMMFMGEFLCCANRKAECKKITTVDI